MNIRRASIFEVGQCFSYSKGFENKSILFRVEAALYYFYWICKCLYVIHNKKIIGYFVLFGNRLGHVYIAPDSRHKHILKKILAYSRKACRYRYIEACIKPNNLEMYKHLGFEVYKPLKVRLEND